MKSRIRALEARLSKLNTARYPPNYVVTLSEEEWSLPEAKQRKLITERSGGRPVMVAPWRCATSEEWIAMCYRQGWIA